LHSTRRIHNDCLSYCAKCVEITGTVRLPDLTATVGTAHLSTSGLALNMVIDQQLHTVPLRSLIQVLERESPEGTAVCTKG